MAGDRRLSRPDASLPDWEVPDSAYRPIPIVWFTGALLLEMCALTILSFILRNQSGWIVLGLAAALSWGVWVWTWDRGMKDAGQGWKVATALMLLMQFSFAAIPAVTRL